MKIVKEWHYLVRIKDFDFNVTPVNKWRTYCYNCFRNIEEWQSEAGFILEVVSYSAGNCNTCNAVHVTPPGMRPPFKMRTVRYQIVASYPEYDLTA